MGIGIFLAFLFYFLYFTGVGMVQDNNVYNGDSIEVLEGLEPVKRRAGMYTDTSRPNHLGMEVIDNSVDEALAGYADKIEVVLYADESLSVSDNGRGMPVDLNTQENVPGIELILGRLHAGGKFSNKNYTFSGGLHGVGVSVVNALSKRLRAEVRRDGLVYAIEYQNGDKTQDLHTEGTVGQRNTGTFIRFWPDPKYFDSAHFSCHSLKAMLKAKAVLCPGLTIVFKNEITGEKEQWSFKGDLSSYLANEMRDRETVPGTPYASAATNPDSEVSWAAVWCDDGNDSVSESYVNLIPTPLGGTHVNGMRQAFTDAIRDFCNIQNLLPRGLSLTPDDVWNHCSYVLSVKIQEPQFSGQTKERLTSRECAQLVSNVVRDSFSLWLNANTEEARAISDLCIKSAQQRQKTSRSVTRKRAVSGPALPGKLKDCITADPSRSELFLVEGDSAGGSASSARDREYQAVLPLRGKILNTWEKESDDIFGSQAIQDISVAVGLDPGSDDLSGLRYNKICILADADSDGLHIGTLICALFMKHFRKAVEAGHLYVAMPPLYRIDAGNEKFYALDEQERDNMLAKLEKKKKGRIEVTRFKGLGEMNEDQLKETTMDPATRRLVQLTLSDDNLEEVRALMDKLLSKDRAQDRREWLEVKGNLADISD